MRVRLELPLADSPEPMQIELLRPEEWIRQRLEYLVDDVSEQEVESDAGQLTNNASCLRGLFEDEQRYASFSRLAVLNCWTTVAFGSVGDGRSRTGDGQKPWALS